MSALKKDILRCRWCQGSELYERYHDEEWGVPAFDVTEVFERLALESMQAGLSWITVLKKREHMRKRFLGFDPRRLAQCGEPEILDWLNDSGLIRHRGKLEALVQNARLVAELPDFSTFIWQFAPAVSHGAGQIDSIPSDTTESKSMAKELKAQGFRFVGPTTCYAFMQSIGMVNDHLEDCWRFSICRDLQLSARASL